MKQIRLALAAISFISIIVFRLVQAQAPGGGPRSGDSWNPGSRYHELYKSGSATRIKGNVLSMQDLTPYEGMEPGMQIRLDVGGQEMLVHLGPRWFVMQHDMNLTRGEPLVVEGVKIQFGNESAIIANEVLRGERKYILREPTGEPKWTPPAGKKP